MQPITSTHLCQRPPVEEMAAVRGYVSHLMLTVLHASAAQEMKAL